MAMSPRQTARSAACPSTISRAGRDATYRRRRMAPMTPGSVYAATATPTKMPESPAGAVTTASQAMVTMLSPSPSAETPRPARKRRVWRSANRRRYVWSFIGLVQSESQAGLPAGGMGPRRSMCALGSAAGLADPGMVPGRIAEGAVADAVGLVHRFLDHLGAGRHHALEGPVEVRGREVQPAQQALGEQVANRLPVRLRNAGIGRRRLEHDVDVGLRRRAHADPAHAIGAHVVPHLEAQCVAIEGDRLVVIVDRWETVLQFHVHGPQPIGPRWWPLLD